MIVAITGTPGSGKSAYAVSIIYNNLGYRKIYTNIDTKLYHHKIYNSEDILNVPDNSMIIIDEAQNWFKKLNDEFMRFFSYHRHRNIDIYIITQSLASIDKRLVELLEYEINFMKSIFRISNSVFVARYKHNDEVFAVKKYNLKEYFKYYKSFDTSFLRKVDNYMTKYVLMFVIFISMFIFGIMYIRYKFTHSTVVGYSKEKVNKTTRDRTYNMYTSKSDNVKKSDEKLKINEKIDEKMQIQVSKSEITEGCAGAVIGIMEVSGKIVKLYENGYIQRGNECSYY